MWISLKSDCTIEQIDPDVLKTISMHLIMGDVQAAKNAFVANTAMSSSDIEASFYADVQQTVDEFKRRPKRSLRPHQTMRRPPCEWLLSELCWLSRGID